MRLVGQHQGEGAQQARCEQVAGWVCLCRTPQGSAVGLHIMVGLGSVRCADGSGHEKALSTPCVLGPRAYRAVVKALRPAAGALRTHACGL